MADTACWVGTRPAVMTMKLARHQARLPCAWAHYGQHASTTLPALVAKRWLKLSLIGLNPSRSHQHDGQMNASLLTSMAGLLNLSFSSDLVRSGLAACRELAAAQYQLRRKAWTHLWAAICLARCWPRSHAG